MEYTIVFWIVVGVASGWLARSVVPGEVRGGLLADFIVGIFGAVIGGYLFNVLLGAQYGGWIASIAVAFAGAVIFLALLRVFGQRRSVV